MSKKNSREKGKEAEDLAASYLEAKGWTVMDRNYFFQRSEVDIVAFDQSCIIFVEVKWRSSTTFGHPEDFVDKRKIQHIYKAAEAWIYERRMDKVPARFDVISIVQKENEAPEIRHFENAFN